MSLPGCGGNEFYIQDSYCDSSLNNEECGYDGGDCCRCTCREFGYYSACGVYGYDCVDPDAPLDCGTDSPTPSPTIAGYPGCEGFGYFIGDGVCDSSNNNLECGWDGGDCCRCTCIGWCSYFDCLDPSAPTDCATDSPSSSPYGNDDYYYTIYSGPAPISSVITSTGDDDECQGPVWLLSDGRCDVTTNTAVCGWDGGDCCECTCVDGSYSCGEEEYNCLDPAGAGGCSQPTPAPSSEEPGVGLQDTNTTGTSLTSVEVGGVVSIAIFGFVSVGGLIIGALEFIRRKCQARVP